MVPKKAKEFKKETAQEKGKAEVERLTHDLEVHALDLGKLQEITEQLAKVSQELATREEEWLSITLALEG